MNTEEKYVYPIYQEIASHFSHTRSYLWAGIKKFIEELKSDSDVLDAGCGNGRNMFRQDLNFTGIDTCPELAKIASQYGKTFVGNIIDLPFSDNSFDAVICVAVIHHLSTPIRRLKAIKELVRVLKPNGKLFVQVWALENNTKKHIKLIDQNNNQDCLIPWINQRLKPPKTWDRYYHLFKQGELSDIIKNAGLHIHKSYYECENWIVISEKKT